MRAAFVADLDHIQTIRAHKRHGHRDLRAIRQHKARVIPEFFDEAEDVVAFLNSPIIRSEKKLSILERIFASHLNELTMSFIKLVSARGREGVLPYVANEFIALYNLDQNLTVVELVSAVAMEETQKKAIVSTFETKLKEWEVWEVIYE